MDDEGPEVEYLDAWDSDDDLAPRPRIGGGWLLGVVALLVTLAVVAAMTLSGGTNGMAFDPQVSTSPGTVGSVRPSTYPAPDVSFTPVPYPDDVEAEPLTITIADIAPPLSPQGILTYDVSVCVSANSGSITGGRVPIVRNFWTMLSPSTNELLAPMSTDAPEPNFPSQWYFAKGQCAIGKLSFKPTKGFVPQFLTYADQRSRWSWRIS